MSRHRQREMMSDPTLDDEVRVPERVEFSRVRDQIALLNVETGVYFGLDEVGARMWDLLCEHRALRVAAQQLESVFDVEPERLRDDLLRLVRELLEKGLLEIV
jgi:hypothetical protein